MTRPADDERFEIHGFWRTSATYRVRVAFHLKGVKPRETVVDMDGGEQNGAAFRRLNPLGGLPAVIDHGPGQPPVPLTQSLAILEFLDELYPQPPLLPTDAHGRARVRSIAQMLAADTHPLITPRVRKYLSTVGGFDADASRAWLVHWLGTGLRAVEQRLATEPGTGRFCHGDQPTIADICLASLFMVTSVLKIDIDDIPVSTRIVAECERLPAFAAAAPALQVGAPAL